ncbi:MAG: GNAT family N-acetyltransferase [Clostridia bacterium]|nr:GNAT family N-acetyltransferase [Clostridia bacterium]
MTDPVFRFVTADDLDACVALIRDSFATVANEFGFTPENAPRFTAFATTRDRLAWQMKEGRPMFCAEVDGRIVGYYSLCVKPDEACELNNLCVAPNCRHQRIGEALLHHAFAEAASRGWRIMHIGIVEENQRLRRWYERFGFVHTGTQKFDFFPFACGYMQKEL